MSNCKDCKRDPCIEKTCGCPIPDLSSDCVIYKGEPLECSGIATPDTLEVIIKKLDAFICSKVSDASNLGAIINAGTGAEIFKGVNNLGQNPLRSIVSSDSSVTVTQDTNEIDLSVEIPNIKNVVSSDNTVSINETTNNIDLSVDIKDVVSTDGSVGITENANNYDLSVDIPTQVKSNVLETSTSSPAFIENKLPTKTITGNYTIQASDNHHVIVINSANPVTITIPSTGLPTDNFFVGFLQIEKGIVSFSGYDLKPTDFTDEIYGEGHNAALEIIGGNSYIFGSLKAE